MQKFKQDFAPATEFQAPPTSFFRTTPLLTGEADLEILYS